MRVLVALSAVTALLLCGAAWRMAADYRRSASCEMTYMYANYVPIQINDLRSSDHPAERDHGRYKLYLYREDGGASRQVMPPTGHPVLFIPGNAGSYQQVRSVASETSREWGRRRQRRGGDSGGKDLDWYIIDTAEELTAFDSVLLERQAAFALRCLRHLAATYKISPANATHMHGTTAAGGIIIVGHSMGGVVSRLALQRAARNPASLAPGAVGLLVTMASPQAASPVMLHPAMGRLYGRLRDERLPRGVSVVSINGGARDLQVAEPLTALAGVASDPAAAFEASAPDVPGAWCHAGHNELAWCNQLLRRLAVLLLSLSDRRHAAAATAATRLPEGSVVEQESAAATVAGAGQAGGLQKERVGSGGAAADADAALLMYHLRGRVAHSLAATPAAMAAAAAAAVALGKIQVAAAAGNATAAAAGVVSAAAAAAVRPVFSGPWAALDASIGPRACSGRGLPWHLAVLRRRHAAAGAPLFLNGSELDDGRGDVVSWDVPASLQSANGLQTPSSGTAGAGAGADANGGIAGAGAGGLLLVVSAAKPCDGFRLWLELDGGLQHGEQDGQTPYPTAGADGSSGGTATDAAEELQQADGASGGGRNELISVDLSHAAAPLPCIDDAAALQVKNPDKWTDVLRGRDYFAPAAWVLRVPLPLLAHARRVHLWLAPKGASSVDGGPRPWTSASIQWLEAWPGPGAAVGSGAPGSNSKAAAANTSVGSSSSRVDGSGGKAAQGVLHLGPFAALRAVERPSGGPATLRLRLSWPALTRRMRLRWRETRHDSSFARLDGTSAAAAAPAAAAAASASAGAGVGSSSSSSGGSGSLGGSGRCWRPALVSADWRGGDEHVRANMSALPLSFQPRGSAGEAESASSQAFGTSGGHGGSLGFPAAKATFTAAGTPISSTSGVPRPNASEGGGGDRKGSGEPLLLLLLDPRCDYSLWLEPDVTGALWKLLLGHSSIALGLTVALLLLALSHQQSALIQLSALKAGVQLLDSYPGAGFFSAATTTSTTAAAAAASMGGGVAGDGKALAAAAGGGGVGVGGAVGPQSGGSGSAHESPFAAAAGRPAGRSRLIPSVSLGGANLAPPVPTPLPRSLDAVLGDSRVWLCAAALLAALSAIEWAAAAAAVGTTTTTSAGVMATTGLTTSLGGTAAAAAVGTALPQHPGLPPGLSAGGPNLSVASVPPPGAPSSPSGGEVLGADAWQAPPPLASAAAFALRLSGLRRLSLRPPAAGVACLAIVSVALLLITTHAAVLVKVLTGGSAALVLRCGRALAGSRRYAALPGGDGDNAAHAGNVGGGGDGSSGEDEEGCPGGGGGLLGAPGAVLDACVSGPPTSALDCGGSLQTSCLPAPLMAAAAAAAGAGRGGGWGRGRSAGGAQVSEGGAAAGLLAALWGAAALAGRVLAAAAICMPHPAIGLGVAICALFITWTPPRITNALVRLSLPGIPISAALRRRPRRSGAPAGFGGPQHEAALPAVAAAAGLRGGSFTGGDGGGLRSRGSLRVDLSSVLGATTAAAGVGVGTGGGGTAGGGGGGVQQQEGGGGGHSRTPSKTALQRVTSTGGGTAGGAALPPRAPAGAAVAAGGLQEEEEEWDAAEGIGGAAKVPGRGGPPLLRRGTAASRSYGRLAQVAAVGMGASGGDPSSASSAVPLPPGPRTGAALRSGGGGGAPGDGSFSRDGSFSAGGAAVASPVPASSVAAAAASAAPLAPGGVSSAFAAAPSHMSHMQQPVSHNSQRRRRAPWASPGWRPAARGPADSNGGGSGIWGGAASEDVARMQQLMHQGWLLLYGCCLLLMVPSFLAWAKLPIGQQHWAHPRDALLCAPILLHALALARGDPSAYSGLPASWFFDLAGPPAAAAVSSFSPQPPRHRRGGSNGPTGAAGTRVGGAGAAGSVGIGGALGAGGAGWLQLPEQHVLHKKALRWLAAYAFLSALQSGACGALAVCAAAAALMLGGRAAAGAVGAAKRGAQAAAARLLVRFGAGGAAAQSKKQG